jgi:hypothetical protein
MDIGHKVSGIALTVGKDDLCLRVVDQYTDQFTARVTGSAKYSYFYE